MAQWTAREERREEVLVAGPAERLHALLDAPGPPPGVGEELPPLWHWLYHLPADAQRALGADGHPETGGFLPPAPHPRRMFAASEVSVIRPLRIAARAVRVGVASEPVAKVGRSGPLAFVAVRYVVDDDEGGRLVEQQQLVYRSAGGAASNRVPAEVPAWPWELRLVADERLLFRFSALTFNAHRIHYDLPYATGVEGYPGLVVHGPLLAIGLAEVLRRFCPERAVTRFAFRAEQPAFAPTTVHFVGEPDDEGGEVRLRALDDDGVALMTATATTEARNPARQ